MQKKNGKGTVIKICPSPDEEKIMVY